MESFKVLKGGAVLGIFPEGKRTRGGFVGPFHEGFAGIAIKAKVPVLPAAIVNSEFCRKRRGPFESSLANPSCSAGKPTDHDVVTAFFRRNFAIPS